MTAAVGDVDREDEVVAGGSSRGPRRFSIGEGHVGWVVIPKYQTMEDTALFRCRIDRVKKTRCNTRLALIGIRLRDV